MPQLTLQRGRRTERDLAGTRARRPFETTDLDLIFETVGERTARCVLYSEEREEGEGVHDPDGCFARERIKELQQETETALLVRQLRSARRKESSATGRRVIHVLQRIAREVLAALRISTQKKCR